MITCPPRQSSHSMRSRALLHLLRPDGEPGELERLGESNSLLPALWRTLLTAPCELAPADAARLFEGTVSRCMAADAEAAFERVRRLCRWLRQASAVRELVDVVRYLQAIEQHLAERVAAWTLAGEAAPLFVVTLDEFALDPLTVRCDSERWWQAFRHAGISSDASIEGLLACVSTRASVGEWRTWSETFGFAMFEHPFFAEAFRQPQRTDYRAITEDAVTAERTQWPLVHGLGVVLESERYGYADAHGRRAIPPQFDLADDFTAHGVARVCRQRRYGLVRADGTYAMPLRNDAIEWRDDVDGWLCRSDAGCTLLHGDGSAWLSQSWDAIDVLVARRWLRVCRDGRTGLLHWSGETRLPCSYTRIEALEPYPGAPAHVEELLRIGCERDRSRPGTGIWDARRGGFIVPCSYDDVWLVRLGSADRYGFIVIAKLPYERGAHASRHRMGLLDARGHEIVPPDYGWLGVRTNPGKRGALECVREALDWACAQHRPLPAGLPDGRSVTICIDDCAGSGVPAPEIATLRAPAAASVAASMSASIAAAFYKFVTLDDAAGLRAPLLARCEALQVKGTILLAREGINGTIAGQPDDVRAVLAWLRQIPQLAALEHKESPAAGTPFYRMKVRLKREIVTMGVPHVNAATMAGTYVKPEDWNALIAAPDVVLIDARNDYEVAMGTFAGALNPQTRSFRELPDWLRKQEPLKSKPRVAMFCTGGIRCEKSTAFLRSEGFEHVYHLQGGILKYLETISPEQSRWQGECFVFDERVGLGHGLTPSEHELCRSCREPLAAAEKASPLYVEGVSCPKCYHSRSEAKKRGLAERQRQVELARRRNDAHLGVRQELRAKLER